MQHEVKLRLGSEKRSRNWVCALWYCQLIFRRNVCVCVCLRVCIVKFIDSPAARQIVIFEHLLSHSSICMRIHVSRVSFLVSVFFKAFSRLPLFLYVHPCSSCRRPQKKKNWNWKRDVLPLDRQYPFGVWVSCVHRHTHLSMSSAASVSVFRALGDCICNCFFLSLSFYFAIHFCMLFSCAVCTR